MAAFVVITLQLAARGLYLTYVNLQLNWVSTIKHPLQGSGGPTRLPASCAFGTTHETFSYHVRRNTMLDMHSQ